VRYKDQSGVWVEKSEEIDVAIRTPSDVAPQNGNAGIFFLAAGIIVVAGAAYWYFRMRKKPEKHKRQ